MTDPSSLDTPERAPEENRQLYGWIRSALSHQVAGHAAALDRLALVGLGHVVGLGKQRVLLIGPSGCGKTTLASALAKTLGLPFEIVDAAAMAENNWSGQQLEHSVQALYRSAGGDMRLLRKAVVVLDEIDKLALQSGLPGAVATGTSADYRRGKQESVLALMGGADIRFSAVGDRTYDMSWSAAEALIIACGVFPGLRAAGEPSPADLQKQGLIRELVERFGQVIRLQPLGVPELGLVLEQGLQRTRCLFQKLGYDMVLPEVTLRYVAAAVARGCGDAGPRSATTWLEVAAQRRLLELLASNAATGSTVTLTPDDIDLPPIDAVSRRRRSR